MSDETLYGKPTAKKANGACWWYPAVTTAFGPKVLPYGDRQDSPYKARKEAERMIASIPSQEVRND